MKKAQKKILLFAFCFLFIVFLYPQSTHAAVKLNKTNLTICRYHSATLRMQGTSQKVKWKSASKTVATVNKKGKVTGVNAGRTIITATVGKKKYTCKLTVKDFPSETILAAYGFRALYKIVPDASTLRIDNVWIGSTVSNIPVAILDCQFKDQSGKQIHSYVYTYQQEQESTTCYNVQTSFYPGNLILKFDRLEMDSVQSARVTHESIRTVVNAYKYIFSNEKIKIHKGKNFDTLNTWLKL